jgi:electron transfer flavoprotein beta subunit
VSLDIAILLSTGCHPASGRGRRAEIDAKALEMALALGARLHGIHAGDPADPALRDYLGMGLERLTVLRQPRGCDVLPALVRHLETVEPDLVLAGTAAEDGPGSGMLPYALAQALGLPILPAAAETAVNNGLLDMLQALPRGRRRMLRANLPCLVTVDRSAKAARPSAYARARRGAIDIVEMTPGPSLPADSREIPARRRPRRLKIMTGGSAAERYRAATEMQAGGGKLMVDPPADEAARAIMDYLRAEGILAKAG